MFIERTATRRLLDAISSQASVALVGPRQTGKTTLAHKISADKDTVYVDLQRSRDRQMLVDPDQFFESNSAKLIILDEIHTMPEIFAELRGTIDRSRLQGRRTGLFLLLGSASLELIKQGSESLAGRMAYVDLPPITLIEAASADISSITLWIRGGFPDSLTARTDQASFNWRESFIRSFMERDIRLFSERTSSVLLEQLLSMLSHAQGSLLNLSALSKSLGVSTTTVRNYIDFMEKLMLVRKLRPFHANVKKQLVKRPKIYVRDSGLVHALLGLHDELEILRHPVVGFSWEGFVIENLLTCSPSGTQASFYRTAKGAEIDLLLHSPDGLHSCAIEIKRNPAAPLRKGFHFARHDINPDRSFIVHSGEGRYPQGDNIEAIGLFDLCNEIHSLWR